MQSEGVHYIQSKEWADIKSNYGWKVEELACEFVDSGHIRVYSRLVVGVGRLLYIPCASGITSSHIPEFTELLYKHYSRKGFGIRLELNQLEDSELLKSYAMAGWKRTQNHAQYRHTILIDLTKSVNDIYASFKSRGRYEVAQAQKAGVIVKEVKATPNNLNKMYELMVTTSLRNKFFIRDKKFTMAYWDKFAKKNMLKLFFAYHEDELLAGSVILMNGTHAWNKDGGSTRSKVNSMAPRLIQWEVMKSLKAAGIHMYDLGGIPDPSNFNTSSIPGIYIFKSGFSKETHMLMPTLELPLNRRYKLWPKAEKQWLRIYNLFAHNLWW